MRLCAAVVLGAPLSLLGTINEESIKELRLTKYVDPVFPLGLRYEGVAEGYVSIAVSRTVAGEPGDILVLTASHPRFADAAVEAVREWRFAPADGTVAPPARIVRIGFKVEGMVVVFPITKNSEELRQLDLGRDRMQEPVQVPALTALAQVPKALVQPMPAYPAALTGRKSPGNAAVRFYVDEAGRVRLPEVIAATAPEFAAAALTAVAQWRYEPPQADGRPVVASDHWAFQFKAAN
jgi:TonB family protein